MNIHLMLTDLWFYLFLFLLLADVAVGGFLLYALCKVAPMLKSIRVTRKSRVSVDTVPVPAASSLRARLQNDTSNN